MRITFSVTVFIKNVSMPVYIYEEKGDAGKLSVFAVFDGMGGADYGETASLIAAENLDKYFAEITAKERIFSGEEAILYMNAALCIEMEKTGKYGKYSSGVKCTGRFCANCKCR